MLVLTVIQFFTEGTLGCVFGAATETLPALSAITPSIVASMVFLAVFASVIAFGIQNVALAYIPPAQGALLLSLESVFGVVFSVLLYGEVVTGRLLLGFALIFAAIVISETFPLKRKGKGKSVRRRRAARRRTRSRPCRRWKSVGVVRVERSADAVSVCGKLLARPRPLQ